MKTVLKLSNSGFTAEVKRGVNKKNKPFYIVVSENKQVYRNFFTKKMTAHSACSAYLRKKANHLEVVK